MKELFAMSVVLLPILFFGFTAQAIWSNARAGTIRRLTWISLSIITCLVIGCSAVHVPDYSDTTKSWIGIPVDSLIGEWGEPTQVQPEPNGNKVYAYRVSEIRNLPTIRKIIGASEYVFPGAAITEFCNTYFEADAEGIIVKSKYEGNACP
jgi:hypothetical protein